MTKSIMPMFSDDIKGICNGLSIATKQMKKCINEKHMDKLCGQYIYDVCCFWTGNTYVGIKKDQTIQKAFQTFFKELMKLLLTLKNSPSSTQQDKDIADELLYQGEVYRYLGHGDSSKLNENLELQYNDLYVSWSKNAQNNYIESKLYGKILWIHGIIQNSYYGINLEAIGVSRGTEAEVVFPTIKECIKEVKVYE